MLLFVVLCYSDLTDTHTYTHVIFEKYFSTTFRPTRFSGILVRWNTPVPELESQPSTGIDADASKGETSPGYFNSKLVYSYRCGTIFPWEFPEISLAYYHIFMKGPSRSIIYGQIFWHPHPHPHIASPACIYHQNQLSFAVRVSFHLTIHFENAGNICNKIDP